MFYENPPIFVFTVTTGNKLFDHALLHHLQQKFLKKNQLCSTYKQGLPQLCVGQFGSKLKAFVTDFVSWPLVPRKQNGHLEGCYFKIEPSHIVTECYLLKTFTITTSHQKTQQNHKQYMQAQF